MKKNLHFLAKLNSNLAEQKGVRILKNISNQNVLSENHDKMIKGSHLIILNLSSLNDCIIFFFSKNRVKVKVIGLNLSNIFYIQKTYFYIQKTYSLS